MIQNLFPYLHAATTFLNLHFQKLLSIFPLSFSFLLMVQAKRAIFQQTHQLTIKLKSSNLVNTKLLIPHETNKTIKEVKRKRFKKKKKKTYQNSLGFRSQPLENHLHLSGSTIFFMRGSTFCFFAAYFFFSFFIIL